MSDREESLLYEMKDLEKQLQQYKNALDVQDKRIEQYSSVLASIRIILNSGNMSDTNKLYVIQNLISKHSGK